MRRGAAPGMGICPENGPVEQSAGLPLAAPPAQATGWQYILQDRVRTVSGHVRPPYSDRGLVRRRVLFFCPVNRRRVGPVGNRPYILIRRGVVRGMGN